MHTQPQHQPAAEQQPSQVDADLTPGNLLTPEQAAQVLGLSAKSLSTWRSTGRHALPYIRVGGRIRYQRTALDAWLEDRQRTSTAAREVA